MLNALLAPVQVHTDDIQKQAENDLVKLICDTYQVILATFLLLFAYLFLMKNVLWQTFYFLAVTEYNHTYEIWVIMLM